MNWKKKVGWTLALIAGLIVVAAIGGYFYLNSSAFRRFAVRKIVEATDDATGGRAQIGGFDFKLSTLTAHLYDIVLRGDGSANAPPLLQVDKLTVGLKIQSVLHRKITLSELLVEHPVAHLRVDREGNSNFPHPPPSDSSGHASIFDLAIGHLALENGEVNYNDKKIPLEADLHDLATNATFETLRSQYSGSISYDNGHLQYGRYSSLPHSFSARFSATPSVFSLEPAILKVASSSLSLHARAMNYNDPVISADYDARIHTQDFASMLPVKTTGDVSLTGKLDYRSRDKRSFLRNIAVQGRMGSDALGAASSEGEIELAKLRGSYQLADGTLRATGVEAETLGGGISADFTVENLDQRPYSRVRASLRNISLRAAQQAMRKQLLNRVAISGAIDGTAEASWAGAIGNIHLNTDLVIRAAEGGANPSAVNLPVQGIVHAAYDGPRDSLSIRQTTLRIPSTRLTANGEVSKHSQLQIQATTADLQQLAGLIAALRSGPSNLPAVAGSASLNATVTGSPRRPQISGQMAAQDLRVQDSRWKTVQLSFAANASQIAVSHATLVNAQRGKATLNATVALNNWSYAPSNSIHADLSVQQMPMADLQRIANLHYPVSGDVSASASVDGSQLDPRGAGSLEIAKARAYGQPFRTVAVKFLAQNSSISAKLNVVADAGSATSSVSYTPKTHAYNVRLDAPSIALQKLRAVEEKNLQVKGTLSASVSGQGTLDNPQLNASVEVPTLVVREKPITAVKADVRVANQQADLTLNAQVVDAAVRARGHVNLSGDYQADASADTAAVPLDLLLATYAGQVPDGFQGRTELHATLKGPLKDRSRIEAHVVIPTLSASYQSLQIEAAGPIRADYAHSVITLQPAELRGTGTSLHLQGSYPLAGGAAPSLTAQGSVDVRILQVVYPDVRSSGKVTLDIHTAGPGIQGQVRLQSVALATDTAPLGVEKLNGTLSLDNGRLQISEMTGQVGGGQVSAGGSIAYRPSLAFDIALQGKSMRVRYPEGIRSVLDSNLTWTGTAQSSTLRGRVLIDSLSFTPDFDLAGFGDQFSSSTAGLSQPGFTDTINLQLIVQSNSNFSATSSQVSVEGNADLRVTGTASSPVITGRADLTSGELFYRNVRYELQRGIITFDDPNETRPVLNVSVSTTIEQYNLTLSLRGTFDKLTTSYVSDPPLATSDIINLIARGQTGAESAASSQSTDSMIASQAASQISGGVQKLAGISSLQIDPLLGGANGNPSARVAIQQRVTKNFLFTFSTDVSQPGSETVQGDYQINKRWSVSVTRNQLGGVSIDGRYHTRF